MVASHQKSYLFVNHDLVELRLMLKIITVVDYVYSL